MLTKVIQRPLQLIVMLTIFYMNCSGQTLEPGYIIINNGDTLKGWVNYRAWGRNPSSIQFQVTNPGMKVRYVVDQLREIQVTDADHYIRAELILDNRPLDTEYPASQQDTLQTVGWVRELVKGDKISLYSYFNNRAHYLVKRPGDSTMTELKYQNGFENGMYYDLKYYQADIRSLLDLSEKLNRDLESVSYSDMGFIEFFRKVNELPLKEKKKYSAGAHLKIEPLVGAGILVSTNQLDPDHQYIKSFAFSNTSSTFYKAGINLVNGRGLQNVWLNAEIRYSTNSINGHGIDVGSDFDTLTYKLRYHSIQTGIGLGYFLIHRGPVHFYAGCFSAVNFNSYQQNTFTYSYPQMTIMENYIKLNKQWVSFALRGGIVVMRRLEIGYAREWGDFQGRNDLAWNTGYNEFFAALHLPR